MPHNPKWWDDKETALLIELRTSGMSYHEIGERFGRSGSSCKAKYYDVIGKEYRRGNRTIPKKEVALPTPTRQERAALASLDRDCRARIDPPLKAAPVRRRYRVVTDIPARHTGPVNVTAVLMGDPPPWRSALASEAAE